MLPAGVHESISDDASQHDNYSPVASGEGELQREQHAERHDLDEEASAAFRPTWPEFIFHDPISAQCIKRVEEYFPDNDVMLLDYGQVVDPGQSRSAGTGR